jgi:UDP-N-acetylglucosamine acyltransferase
VTGDGRGTLPPAFRVASNVQIHPTAVIGGGACIGARSIIHAHAIIDSCVEIGEDVVVHPFAVLGGDPQDLRFDPARETGVRIGSRTVIREHVTVNRATASGTFTDIGGDCFLMAASHVAHDCRIADRVILANGVLLGGHVHLGERVFLGGAAVVHQYGRVGAGAMVAGGARITRDVPPFCLVAERNALIGLNVVGLRRSGVERAAFREIKDAFRAVHRGTGNPRDRAAAALASGSFQSAEARRFLEFFADGHRGFARLRRHGPTQSDEDLS